MLDHGWTLTKTESGAWEFKPPQDAPESRGPP